MGSTYAPLAQLDRACGYGPQGRGFEFSTARQKPHLYKDAVFVYNKEDDYGIGKGSEVAVPRYGFVRSELEIKTLILHVLNHAGVEVTFENLLSMVFVDGAIDYFEFTTYLASLADTEHIEINSDSGIDKYQITSKGKRDLASCIGMIPRVVLRRAEEETDKVVEEISRRRQVNVKVVEVGESFVAECKLRDENGEILSLSMSAPTRSSARELTRGFYRNAEDVYNTLLSAILKNEEEKRD